MEIDERTPTERIAGATWLLANGRAVTSRSLARDLGITPRGARYLLKRLSNVLPLTVDDGVWRLSGHATPTGRPPRGESRQNGQE